jgi:hypothetical protein
VGWNDSISAGDEPLTYDKCTIRSETYVSTFRLGKLTVTPHGIANFTRNHFAFCSDGETFRLLSGILNSICSIPPPTLPIKQKIARLQTLFSRSNEWKIRIHRKVLLSLQYFPHEKKRFKVEILLALLLSLLLAFSTISVETSSSLDIVTFAPTHARSLCSISCSTLFAVLAPSEASFLLEQYLHGNTSRAEFSAVVIPTSSPLFV